VAEKDHAGAYSPNSTAPGCGFLAALLGLCVCRFHRRFVGPSQAVADAGLLLTATLAQHLELGERSGGGGSGRGGVVPVARPPDPGLRVPGAEGQCVGHGAGEVLSWKVSQGGCAHSSRRGFQP
jgi:hypothetical protein